MKRTEKHFASPAVTSMASSLGTAFRAARVARKRTREDAASRARVSVRTLARIEAGDVAVALGAWLAAAESLDLLALLDPLANPSSDMQGESLRRLAAPKRVRQSKKEAARYDF